MYWWFFTSNNFICIYLFVCFILFIYFAVNVMNLRVLTLHCQISSLEAIMSIKDWRLINMPSLTTTILITATEIYNNTSWAWWTDFCILWDAYHALFCIFGNFYVSGTQDAEVRKSLKWFQWSSPGLTNQWYMDGICNQCNQWTLNE